MKYCSLFFLLCVFVCSFSMGDEDKEQPRLLVHLLEYIAADYPGAVEGGKVKSPAEYEEQKEFVKKAVEALANVPTLKKNERLSQDLTSLEKLVLARAQSDDVAKTANRVKSRVIELAKIDVAPTTWPNRAHGQKLFSKNCATCHGVNGHGDGPSGKTLDPRPTNFHDGKMASVPPFQAFNTIRLGVPGTGMAEFPAFSDREVWDLAFYVSSLRFENGSEKPGEREPSLALQEVATKSDEELLAKLSGSAADKKAILANTRLYLPKREDSNQFISLAKQHLNNAWDQFRGGHFDDASKSALLAYLDGVEPVEPRLRSRDAAFVTDLEMKMLEVRSIVDKRGETPAVRDRVSQAEAALDKAALVLQEGGSSPTVTFSVAAGIFLREAFEAVLLLITILGVLRSVGSRRAVLYVHGGWIAAVLLGVACWFFSGWVMQISGAQREFLEGTISLFAVAVLLYFGFWLHRKTEIGKWRAFIHEMLESVAKGASLWGLAGISFMAVFREAFETVLFLRALLLEAEGQQMAVAGGVLFAFVIVVILSAALLKFSAKIPIRQLFDISSMVMIVLAFILVGKAAHSFQETGLLTITRLPTRVTIDLLGMYPTYEGMMSQIAVVVLAVSFWWLGKRTPTNQQLPA